MTPGWSFFIHSAGWLTDWRGGAVICLNTMSDSVWVVSCLAAARPSRTMTSAVRGCCGQVREKFHIRGKLLIRFQAHRWDVWRYHHVDQLHKKAFLISYLPHAMLFEVVLIRCVTVIKATNQNTDVYPECNGLIYHFMRGDKGCEGEPIVMKHSLALP